MIEDLAIYPLLAVWDLGSITSSKTPLAQFTDLAVAIGAGATVLAALLIWAKFFRKNRRRRKRIAHRLGRKVYVESSDAESPEPVEADEPDGEEDEETPHSHSHHHHHHSGGRRRYKYRYRRRSHRGRNPTLAETGGLPASPDAFQQNGSPPPSNAVPRPTLPGAPSAGENI